MPRDVRFEMNQRISTTLAGRLVDGEGAESAARQLVRRLRAEDPTLLLAWLQLHAVETLGRHIARRHPAVQRGPRPVVECAPVDQAAS